MSHLPFRPYKLSAAHRLHTAQGATWIECGGWRLPASFGNPEGEAEQVRRAGGLADLSAIGKLDVKGTSIDARLSECAHLPGVRATARVKPGHAMLLTTPGEEGRVRDALPALFGRTAGCAHVTDVTSGLSAFALVGPRAPDTLASLTAVDVRRDRFHEGCAVQCDLAHVHATIHRNDWGALPGYLVLVGRDVGEYAWTTIRAAAEPKGLTPFGILAERLLRDTSVFESLDVAAMAAVTIAGSASSAGR